MPNQNKNKNKTKKKQKKNRSSIPDLDKDDKKEEVTESNKENVDVLVNVFTSLFTKDSGCDMPDIVPKDVPEPNNIELNPSVVKKILDKLNVNKSPGPDLLHPRLLKE